VKNIFSPIVNAEWKIKLILFLVSFIVFYLYFQVTFQNINKAICAESGDGLKNYYTFIYHTVKDKSLTEFSGLNYPYGEHCVYTDCQPLFTFILRYLPFTHGYLVGILHFLMLFSLIITPNILYSILKLYKVNSFISFFSALAIALITPQLDRMGGHFGLSYVCMIPIAIYLMSKFAIEQQGKTIFQLFAFNCALFLIHPYFGLGTSIFTFVTLLLYSFQIKDLRSLLKDLLPSLIAGLGPILFFTLFMKLSDHHTGRPTEPLGLESGIATVESVFVPTTGPFAHFMEHLIRVKHREWEGISYVGFFPLLMVIASIFLFPFFQNRFQFNKIVKALFVTGLLLLLFSFGFHIKVLNKLHLEIAALKQFRSLGRFAWYFCFVAPIFGVTYLYHFFIGLEKEKLRKMLLIVFPLLFLSINFSEGHVFLTHRSRYYLKAPNLFLEEYHWPVEKELLAEISKLEFSSILPVPYYCIGSDVYDRNGSESAYVSMFLSYHCNKPIFGGSLARTSVQEVKNTLDLFNEYSEHSGIPELSDNETILVIKTAPEHLPSEERLIRRLKLYKKIGDTEIYLAKKKDLSIDAEKINAMVNFELNDLKQIKDTLGVYFIRATHRKPYRQAQITDYEKAMIVQKNKFSGNYILSFRYYYEKETGPGLDASFIQAKIREQDESWELMSPMRHVTGFYDGYDVFEKKITLDPKFRYKLQLQGLSKGFYHISHFMLRPEESDVKFKDVDGKIYLNNFLISK
jgi:hypothetical protein